MLGEFNPYFTAMGGLNLGYGSSSNFRDGIDEAFSVDLLKDLSTKIDSQIELAFEEGTSILELTHEFSLNNTANADKNHLSYPFNHNGLTDIQVEYWDKLEDLRRDGKKLAERTSKTSHFDTGFKAVFQSASIFSFLCVILGGYEIFLRKFGIIDYIEHQLFIHIIVYFSLVIVVLGRSFNEKYVNTQLSSTYIIYSFVLALIIGYSSVLRIILDPITPSQKVLLFSAILITVFSFILHYTRSVLYQRRVKKEAERLQILMSSTNHDYEDFLKENNAKYALEFEFKE